MPGAESFPRPIEELRGAGFRSRTPFPFSGLLRHLLCPWRSIAHVAPPTADPPTACERGVLAGVTPATGHPRAARGSSKPAATIRLRGGRALDRTFRENGLIMGALVHGWMGRWCARVP
jgi:hypothetical protein